MKTLLAIINEPKESKNFIQYAAAMAIDFNANVHLLHAQNTNIFPLGTTGYTGIAAAQIQQNQQVLADTAKEIMAKHIEEVTSKLPKSVVINYSTELGVPSFIAQEFVSNNNADMVILEGQKNEDFSFQTSENMEIIENVECPVFIIPYSSVYKPFTEIIYATDYKEEDVSNLRKLIGLTQLFSPNITALHITDSIDFEEDVKKVGFLDVLREKVDYKNLSVKIQNESINGDMVQRIDDYALRIKAGLIVVLKENKSFFERIFKTNHTKMIIKKSMLPVLVFHEKE